MKQFYKVTPTSAIVVDMCAPDAPHMTPCAAPKLDYLIAHAESADDAMHVAYYDEVGYADLVHVHCEKCGGAHWAVVAWE